MHLESAAVTPPGGHPPQSVTDLFSRRIFCKRITIRPTGKRLGYFVESFSSHYRMEDTVKTEDKDDQIKRFKGKARELECDESEERFTETLKRIAPNKHERSGKKQTS